jgi:hypothetical protein
MKAIINRENYEVYLIDFIDGQLDAETSALVLLFLEQNPDIAEQLDALSSCHLEVPDVEFENKYDLKQTESAISVYNSSDKEVSVLAYLEGDLSPKQKLQFEKQLAVDNLLKKYYVSYQPIKLIPEPIHFEPESLYRIELADNQFILQADFETICIRYLEGEPTAEEAILLESALQNSPIAKQIFDQYTQTILKPAAHIVYPHKASLKRRALLFPIQMQTYWPSIAASVAILLLFYLFNNQSNSPEKAMIDYQQLALLTQPESMPTDLQSPKLAEHQKATNHSNQGISAKENRPNRLNSKIEIQEVPIITQSRLKCEKPIELIKMDLAPYTCFINLPATDNNSLNNTFDNSSSTNYIAKATNILERIYQQQKDRIIKESPKESVRSIANIAVNGYNLFTESNVQFGNQAPPETDESENP